MHGPPGGDRRTASRVGEMSPAKWFFRKHESEPTTEVAIRRGLGRGPLHRAGRLRRRAPVGDAARRRQPARELDLARLRLARASAPSWRCCPSGSSPWRWLASRRAPSPSALVDPAAARAAPRTPTRSTRTAPARATSCRGRRSSATCRRRSSACAATAAASASASARARSPTRCAKRAGRAVAQGKNRDQVYQYFIGQVGQPGAAGVADRRRLQPPGVGVPVRRRTARPGPRRVPSPSAGRGRRSRRCAAAGRRATADRSRARAAPRR